MDPRSWILKMAQNCWRKTDGVAARAPHLRPAAGGGAALPGARAGGSSAGAGRTRALGICRGALLSGPNAGRHARGGCQDRDGALPADHGCRGGRSSRERAALPVWHAVPCEQDADRAPHPRRAPDHRLRADPAASAARGLGRLGGAASDAARARREALHARPARHGLRCVRRQEGLRLATTRGRAARRTPTSSRATGRGRPS